MIISSNLRAGVGVNPISSTETFSSGGMGLEIRLGNPSDSGVINIFERASEGRVIRLFNSLIRSCSISISSKSGAEKVPEGVSLKALTTGDVASFIKYSMASGSVSEALYTPPVKRGKSLDMPCKTGGTTCIAMLY
jgi:hypothetical protein